MAETEQKPHRRIPNILEVPLEAEGEVVTFDLDNDLPEDPEEICVLLENEKCTMEYWLSIGTAYARNGLADSAIDVVNKALQTPIAKSENELLALYSCLAWLYIGQLNRAPVEIDEKDAVNGIKPKNEYHRLATEASNQAFQLDRGWSVNILTRGKLMLDMGNYDDALQPFQTVLKQSLGTNLFAQMGKARVLYHKKNYRGALELYQKVLYGRPDFKPDPRIGIGLCFWKLNDREGALQSWERSLELNAESEPANTLLGIYYLTRALENPASNEFAENYAKGLGYVQKCYKKNPNYPECGILLSSYFYSKKNMQGVIKLSQNAVKNADLPSLVADAYFWIGRAYHFMEDYEQALKYYTLADEKSRGTSLLALLGKGLIHIAQDSPEALLTLESAVDRFPKSLEALLLYGLLMALRATSDAKRKQKAVSLLERYLNVCKEQKESPSSQALVMLSTLYEDNDVVKAEEYLKTALEQSSFGAEDDTGNDIDKALLYNNIGTFQYFRGNFEDAETNFTKADQLLSEREDAESKDALVTTTFNLARLFDAWGQPDRAIELYKKTLDLAPHYLDASIRMTYLSIVLNKDNASDELKEIMQESDDNLEVRAIYGWWLQRQKRSATKNINEDIEQRHYKHSLVDLNKHDTYSLVALGNLYLSAARELRVNKSGEQDKKDKLYFKASEFFDKALQIDQHNAYAAQGIAIIFAETKRAELALNIFSKIRETVNDITIFINMGHCLAELRQFSKAIEAYDYALDISRGGSYDGQLMTLLGRAWYGRGLSEKNLDAYKKALDFSERALEKAPTNAGLQFNVGYVQFQLADLVRKLPESQRSIDDIEYAIESLDKGVMTMQELAGVKYPPFPASELEQRALMGRDTLRKQLDRALQEQKEYEEQNKTKLEEARKLREQKQKEKEEAEEAKRLEEEERQKKLAEERRKLQEEAQQWTEQARLEAEENIQKIRESFEKKKRYKEMKASEKKSPKKTKKGKGETNGNAKPSKFKSDDFVVDSSDEEEEPVTYDDQSSEGENDNLDPDLFGGEEHESETEKKRANEEEDEASIKKRRTGLVHDEEDDYDADVNESPARKKRGNVILDDEDDENMEG